MAAYLVQLSHGFLGAAGAEVKTPAEAKQFPTLARARKAARESVFSPTVPVPALATMLGVPRTHGGAGRRQGRAVVNRDPVLISALLDSPAQREVFRRLGGSAWLRRQINRHEKDLKP